MKVLPWILVTLLVLAVLFLWSRQQEVSSPLPDTTEHVDTIPFYKPILRDSVVIRYETIKLPLKGFLRSQTRYFYSGFGRSRYSYYSEGI